MRLISGVCGPTGAMLLNKAVNALLFSIYIAVVWFLASVCNYFWQCYAWELNPSYLEVQQPVKTNI